jgi:hypothetical protein
MEMRKRRRNKSTLSFGLAVSLTHCDHGVWFLNRRGGSNDITTFTKRWHDTTAFWDTEYKGYEHGHCDGVQIRQTGWQHAT